MREEHLVAAYTLAVSSIPTEDLFEEETYRNVFPDVVFSSIEREFIGSEATHLRGNESYDWISVGADVDFYSNNFSGARQGRVVSIDYRPDDLVTNAIVQHSSGRQYMVSFHEMCQPSPQRRRRMTT